MSKFDKYLKIIAWARRRYTINGILILSTGYELSRYSKIEVMAWNKYLA